MRNLYLSPWDQAADLEAAATATRFVLLSLYLVVALKTETDRVLISSCVCVCVVATIQHRQGERGWGRREEGGRPARRRGGRTQDALPELIGQQKRHCVLERKRILLCD